MEIPVNFVDAAVIRENSKYEPIIKHLLDKLT